MLGAFSALGLAVLGVISTAGPARAHADLVRSDPAAGSVVTVEPDRVILRFSEDVTTRLGTAVRVVGPDGRTLADTHGASAPASVSAGADADADASSSSSTGANTDTLAVPLLRDSAQGTFAVVWHAVAADDGHATEGVVMFSVGHPSAISAVAAGSDPVVRVIQDAAIWLSLGGFALIVGALTLRVAARFADRPQSRGSVPATIGWLVLTAATLVQFLVYGPYASGESWRQAFNRSLIGDTLGTRTGHALAFRAVMLVLLAITGDWLLTWIGDARHRFGPAITTASVAVGLALTWSATSHAADGSSSTVIVAMAATTLHVVAMGVWFGGLVSLLATIRGEADASLVRAFSKLATGAVTVLVATGVYQAWREIGSFSALTSTGYGRLLLAKVGALAVILLVAARSRATARGRTSDTAVDVARSRTSNSDIDAAHSSMSGTDIDVAGNGTSSSDVARSRTSDTDTYAVHNSISGFDININIRALRRTVLLEAAGVAALLLLTTILLGSAPPHTAV